MIHKSIDVSAPIQPILAQRWSGVCYDPARAVSQADLRAIMEAGRWSPSCFGDQPWRYLVCDKTTNRPAWDKAFSCLGEGNQPWCQHAPVLVVICHDTQFVHNDKPNQHAAYDTGAASMSMSMQATALGLMTHQMAGFSADKAREVFAVPERYKPLVMMTIGYQLDEAQLPEQFKARELKPRARAALEARFFAGEWNKGF
jgi:nitroreductase